MLEIWKGATDSNKSFGALWIDFSKAFDCLSHDLFIAKLLEYGLNINSLNALEDYLSNRKQRMRVHSFFSSWEAILSGIDHISILGPLFFKTFMCDMFLTLKTTYLTGYADDNTPLFIRDNTTDMIKSLKVIIENLASWFFK